MIVGDLPFLILVHPVIDTHILVAQIIILPPHGRGIIQETDLLTNEEVNLTLLMARGAEAEA